MVLFQFIKYYSSINWRSVPWKGTQRITMYLSNLHWNSTVLWVSRTIDWTLFQTHLDISYQALDVGISIEDARVNNLNTEKKIKKIAKPEKVRNYFEIKTSEVILNFLNKGSLEICQEWSIARSVSCISL